MNEIPDTVFGAVAVVAWLAFGFLVMLIVNQGMRRDGDVRPIEDEPLLTAVLAAVFWPMVLMIAWFCSSLRSLREADKAQERYVDGLAKTERDQSEESVSAGSD